MKSEKFMELLDPIDKIAWQATIDVIKNFLGNKRAENYKELVANMIEAYKNMGVHMSLKIHFFADHLNFFPENLGKSTFF